MHGEGVIGFLVQFGGAQQRLGRDAADVQAGTAETRFALRIGIGVGFGASGVETELGGADGGDIATRTTTDNEYIELFTGHLILLSEQPR